MNRNLQSGSAERAEGGPRLAVEELSRTLTPITERLRGRCTCSVDAAADLLGIGRSTAYAAARDGSLPVIRVSHRLLVPTAKLLAMLGIAGEE